MNPTIPGYTLGEKRADKSRKGSFSIFDASPISDPATIVQVVYAKREQALSERQFREQVTAPLRAECELLRRLVRDRARVDSDREVWTSVLHGPEELVSPVTGKCEGIFFVRAHYPLPPIRLFRPLIPLELASVIHDVLLGLLDLCSVEATPRGHGNLELDRVLLFGQRDHIEGAVLSSPAMHTASAGISSQNAKLFSPEDDLGKILLFIRAAAFPRLPESADPSPAQWIDRLQPNGKEWFEFTQRLRSRGRSDSPHEFLRQLIFAIPGLSRPPRPLLRLSLIDLSQTTPPEVRPAAAPTPDVTVQPTPAFTEEPTQEPSSTSNTPELPATVLEDTTKTSDSPPVHRDDPAEEAPPSPEVLPTRPPDERRVRRKAALARVRKRRRARQRAAIRQALTALRRDISSTLRPHARRASRIAISMAILAAVTLGTNKAWNAIQKSRELKAQELLKSLLKYDKDKLQERDALDWLLASTTIKLRPYSSDDKSPSIDDAVVQWQQLRTAIKSSEALTSLTKTATEVFPPELQKLLAAQQASLINSPSCALATELFSIQQAAHEFRNTWISLEKAAKRAQSSGLPAVVTRKQVFPLAPPTQSLTKTISDATQSAREWANDLDRLNNLLMPIVNSAPVDGPAAIQAAWKAEKADLNSRDAVQKFARSVEIDPFVLVGNDIADASPELKDLRDMTRAAKDIVDRPSASGLEGVASCRKALEDANKIISQGVSRKNILISAANELRIKNEALASALTNFTASLLRDRASNIQYIEDALAWLPTVSQAFIQRLSEWSDNDLREIRVAIKQHEPPQLIPPSEWQMLLPMLAPSWLMEICVRQADLPEVSSSTASEFAVAYRAACDALNHKVQAYSIGIERHANLAAFEATLIDQAQTSPLAPLDTSEHLSLGELLSRDLPGSTSNKVLSVLRSEAKRRESLVAYVASIESANGAFAALKNPIIPNVEPPSKARLAALWRRVNLANFNDPPTQIGPEHVRGFVDLASLMASECKWDGNSLRNNLIASCTGEGRIFQNYFSQLTGESSTLNSTSIRTLVTTANRLSASALGKGEASEFVGALHSHLVTLIGTCIQNSTSLEDVLQVASLSGLSNTDALQTSAARRAARILVRNSPDVAKNAVDARIDQLQALLLGEQDPKAPRPSLFFVIGRYVDLFTGPSPNLVASPVGDPSEETVAMRLLLASLPSDPSSLTPDARSTLKDITERVRKMPGNDRLPQLESLVIALQPTILPNLEAWQMQHAWARPLKIKKKSDGTEDSNVLIVEWTSILNPGKPPTIHFRRLPPEPKESPQTSIAYVQVNELSTAAFCDLLSVVPSASNRVKSASPRTSNRLNNNMYWQPWCGWSILNGEFRPKTLDRPGLILWCCMSGDSYFGAPQVDRHPLPATITQALEKYKAQFDNLDRIRPPVEDFDSLPLVGFTPRELEAAANTLGFRLLSIAQWQRIAPRGTATPPLGTFGKVQGVDGTSVLDAWLALTKLPGDGVVGNPFNPITKYPFELAAKPLDPRVSSIDPTNGGTRFFFEPVSDSDAPNWLNIYGNAAELVVDDQGPEPKYLAAGGSSFCLATSECVEKPAPIQPDTPYADLGVRLVLSLDLQDSSTQTLITWWKNDRQQLVDSAWTKGISEAPSPPP